MLSAEFEVNADLEDVDVRFNVDAGPGNRDPACGNPADECIRIVAENVEIVLNEAGQPVQEGIFTADADRPTPARLANRSSGEAGHEQAIVALLPGPAAFHVAEEAIPGVAHTAGDRRERLQLRVG